jgi:hypothetical protein
MTHVSSSAAMPPASGRDGQSQEKQPFVIKYVSLFAAEPAPPLHAEDPLFGAAAKAAAPTTGQTSNPASTVQLDPVMPQFIPLLRTNLVLQPTEENGEQSYLSSHVEFSPNSDEMEQCVLDQTTQFVMDACSVERLLLNKQFRSYTSYALGDQAGGGGGGNASLPAAAAAGAGGAPMAAAEPLVQLVHSRCQEDTFFTQLRDEPREAVCAVCGCAAWEHHHVGDGGTAEVQSGERRAWARVG